MKLRAVFFDAGETLLSPHPSFHELFCRVVNGFGYQLSPAEIERAFEALAPSFVEVMDSLGISSWSTSRKASERFWGKVYRAGFQQLGITDRQGKIAAALYEKFTRYESYRLFPDAIPALRATRAAGLKVGLISNFEEWLEGMLAEMKVAELFDLMVISGKEGIEKPDSAIFKIALDRSKVAAHEAVYVGDHPRIDAEGSAAVGMTGVLIDRRDRHPTYRGPKLTSLNQLLPLMKSLSNDGGR